MIVLAIVVLLTGLALAYFSRTTTDRQLAQSSYNDTSSDLLARSALDIIVNDFKQEIINNPTITQADIQPTPYPTPVPADIPNLIRYSSHNAAASRASNISSILASANGRSISATRWNSHYLVPLLQPNATPANSIPVSDFTAPDWVLVTPQGPSTAPSPSAVVGRYAFAVYDEGGLLDMSVAGYPSWSSCSAPTPTATPWLLNVGRKGILAFADLTALPASNASPAPTFPPSQIDNIVGWRNYATTQRTGASFGSFNFSTETDCTKQNNYGSYLLYFGDPPFYIGSLSDKLLASTYPFTAVATEPDPSNIRTDQALATRQELLNLRSSLGFSQNVLQYMGTFSRERNRPAPDWPGLSATGALSEGRFNLNNLALVIPNPGECVIAHGKKRGWQTGKNKNRLCGNSLEVMETFGLFWIKAEIVDPSHIPPQIPGHWRYIGNVGQLPDPDHPPNPHHGIDCFRGANQQNDFFQVLNFALFRSNCAPDATLANTFAVGASLIDQYDSGADCVDNRPADWGPGCDLDSHVVSNNNEQYATHTTVIEYGHGNGNTSTAYGMEPENSIDGTNGDCDPGVTSGGCNKQPHRPTPAPTPALATQVVSRAFTTVGEFGYGIDTSKVTLPTLKFWDSSTTPPFQYAPVLDFFCYNPISSAYPRAGIVNLYTRNAPVIAAMLKSALKNDTLVSPPAASVISQAEATNAANAIVTETQRVLAGTASPAVQQTDLTRAIAGRLANVGSNAAGWTTDEQKEAIARALAEMGQTRTWNLFIDVIVQTGKYAPGTTDVTQANKFTVEGEKRYWLHIALGRDLNTDGSVDVLGTQLEEVTE
jgi:hypothetical protein